MYTILSSTCPYFINFKILNTYLKVIIVETLFYLNTNKAQKCIA